MDDYMKHPQEANLPVLKIVFAETLGSALALASHVPQRILDASLVKLSGFMKIQHNRDYFFSRLCTQLQGKEPSIRDMLFMIELKPLECLSSIKDAGEFACLFWPYFCSLIRMELKKKNEFISSDIAALQAACVIEFFIGYFRSVTSHERERELALKEIESKIELAPYAYTLKDIMKFADANGRPLTDKYGQKDLEDFINKRSFFEGGIEGANLPSLLIFHNRFDEQVFISKKKVFTLLTKQLGEARSQIKRAISERWSKFIKDFRSEPAMENDKDFEKLINQYTAQLAPSLMMILDDKKVFLVQEDLSQAQGGILDNNRVYDASGVPVPLTILLMMNRKDLITDVKILLPFWYSIPILSSIIAFFKRMGRDKKPKNQKHHEEAETPERESTRISGPQGQDLKRAALDYLVKTVPAEHSLDSYLKELENKWRKIMDADVKKQLVADVHSQIKRKLKPIVDARGNRKATAETIEEIADSIIMVSPALSELNNSEKIHTYVALYLTKLLNR
jgi:hypothetical protein